MARPSSGPLPPRPSRRRRGRRWKHGDVPVLGITGGIGAGKSLVASALGARGALTIEADKLGHALLQRRPIRDQVLARFGRDILRDDDPSRIDRKKLGARVFRDEGDRKALEAILHPAMRRAAERLLRLANRGRRHPLIVIDAALLFEAGWDDLCDRVAFVEADLASRFERVAGRRGWSRREFDARERAQWPVDRKRRDADVILVNDGDAERCVAEAGRLFDAIARPPSAPALPTVVGPAPEYGRPRPEPGMTRRR